MAIPTGYDPITLNHWLWFKYQCHECAPAEFQKLFERIIGKARPEFIQIRTYGDIGDRKCDGLLFAEGQSTVFQVYSPDEMKQAEVIDKIDEDLKGAYLHWGDSMRKWVFVYNARRGLAPDIPKALNERQAQYPTVELGHLSNDALWEMARSLSLQQRSEVLGAPNGYGHLFFSSEIGQDEIKHRLANDSFVLIQDLLSPIGLHAVSEALRPAQSFGAPYFIRPTYNELPWTEAARQQQIMLREIIAKGRDLVPRFAVFSLAPIPLIVHLGFLLSDRVEVRYFQFDREKATWKWPSKRAQADLNIQVSGLSDKVVDKKVEVSVAVSLSADIAKIDVQKAAPSSAIFINIFATHTNVMWLRSTKQLEQLAAVFRDTLAAIRSKVPQCSKIHLFYAGPAGGGIVLGQQINPRMNPPVALYQYSQQATPRYQYAFTLTEALS